MMAVSKITDLWNSVKSLAVSQYSESQKLLDFVKKNVNAFQSIENASSEILDFISLDDASGSWLDLIGLAKNVRRLNGESDSLYRERIENSLQVDYAGTARFVIEKVKSLSGDNSPSYIDEAPAVFFVYTPGGSQVHRWKVKQTAPAGVLGLPGAAIQLADGTFLGTSNGTQSDRKKFLAVASDVDNDSKYILTEDNLRIMTEDGLYILTEKAQSAQLLAEI